MNTKHFQLVIAAALAFLLTACNVVEGPKVDPSGFSGSANKVLLEDFTGHTCGYCPRAHDKAAELHDTYGENLIVVAVHAGDFAKIVPGYTRDFNTEMGTAIYDAYAPPSLPIGLINRRKFGTSELTEDIDWGTHVSTVLSEAAKLRIEMMSTFDENTRQLEIEANLEYFTTGTADHKLVVLITEDSIISKQKDYRLPAPQYNENYVHNHVLRSAVTPGNFGIPVKGDAIFLGEKISKTFTFDLPNDHVAENCHIVAYVLDAATQEILQAEQITLMP